MQANQEPSIIAGEIRIIPHGPNARTKIDALRADGWIIHSVGETTIQLYRKH
jgi:hypothetical protein